MCGWILAKTCMAMHIVLHLRQIRCMPYGPWPKMLESVWAQEEASVGDEENDGGVC